MKLNCSSDPRSPIPMKRTPIPSEKSNGKEEIISFYPLDDNFCNSPSIKQSKSIFSEHESSALTELPATQAENIKLIQRKPRANTLIKRKKKSNGQIGGRDKTRS